MSKPNYTIFIPCLYSLYQSILYPGYTIVWLGDIGGKFLKGFTWSEISTLRKRFWSIVSDCKWTDLILTKLNSSQRFRIYYWALCIYYLALCGLNSGYGRESKWLCPEEYQYSKTFEHFSWKTYYILLFKNSLTVPGSLLQSMSPDPIVYPAPLASVSPACFERTLDGASVVSASSALTEFGTWLSEDNPTGGTHGINKPSESSERELFRSGS